MFEEKREKVQKTHTCAFVKTLSTKRNYCQKRQENNKETRLNAKAHENSLPHVYTQLSLYLLPFRQQVKLRN
jgi:hypothetical protein